MAIEDPRLCHTAKGIISRIFAGEILPWLGMLVGFHAIGACECPAWQGRLWDEGVS
jgi:sorbitol-specific phosphotransferase system component IIC